jgi:hypothetical protein
MAVNHPQQYAQQPAQYPHDSAVPIQLVTEPDVTEVGNQTGYILLGLLLGFLFSLLSLLGLLAPHIQNNALFRKKYLTGVTIGIAINIVIIIAVRLFYGYTHK